MLRRLAIAMLALLLTTTSCGDGGDEGAGSITIYSGRSEELVGPLIQQFEQLAGVTVAVRYGDSAELAATILEEGANSPADVFFAQDPASLGAVASAGLFRRLGDGVVESVDQAFSDREHRWVGVSGRARVVVYDATKVDEGSLPETEDGFVAPKWRGRVAIAPTNGSFLAFVAAKILIDGEDATLAWLQAMKANGSPTYPKNSVIVAAVDDGEVLSGLVNHYYLFRRRAEIGETAAANHFLTGGGAGSLVMPAGAGILDSSGKGDAANDFIAFLLSEDAQRYFAEETFEYPLAAGVSPSADLPALRSLNPPPVDLSRLAETLDQATDLVAEAGLL